MASYKKLWWLLIAVLAATFTLLGYLGREVYRQAPPIPARIVTADGATRVKIDTGEGDDVEQERQAIEQERRAIEQAQKDLRAARRRQQRQQRQQEGNQDETPPEETPPPPADRVGAAC